MAELTDADLAWIRDEIGETEPPTDDDLFAMFDEVGSREGVAARVVRRRLAEVAQPGAVSFTIPGEYGENNAALIPLLSKQLARLETLVPLPPGVMPAPAVTSARMIRVDRTGR